MERADTQTDLSARDQRLDEAVTSYLLACQGETAPDPNDWLRRYPDLAGDLNEFFADRLQLEQLTQPLRSDVFQARQIGDYELLEEIARGGMGVVYRARQVSVNRVVALKMMLAGTLAGTEERRRFRREAEAAARLEHPAIVPIYEVGEYAGQPYFTMQYIEGSALTPGTANPRELTRMTTQQIARVLITIARAVHHAHQRGILHRDLKPGNVLVDASGEPHVVDFGLAGRVEASQRITHSGAIVGTPAYMAPEQANGDRHLTTAVDIWALGAILYELLTGQPPFKGATLLDTLVQLRTLEVLSPRVHNPLVPQDLETICLKCLEREPARRYGSAEALAEDLERFLHGEPIRARQASSVERLVKWARRRPTLAGLTACLAALVGLGIVVLLLLLDQTQASLREADLRATQLQQQAEQQQREKQLLAAHHALREGMNELERGEISPGMLWLVRGLEQTPADEVALQRSFRLLLAGWARELHPIDKVFPVTPALYPYISLHPNGRVLARGGSAAMSLCGADGKMTTGQGVEFWDIDTGKQIGSLALPGDRLLGIEFSPDGKRLVTSQRSAIQLWDAEKRTLLHTLQPREPKDQFATAYFLDGGNIVLTLLEMDSLLYRLQRWDAQTGKPLGERFPEAGTRLALANRSGTHLLTGGGQAPPTSQSIQVWNTRTGMAVSAALPVGFDVWSGALSDDGTQVAVGGEKYLNEGPCMGAVLLLDSTTGKRSPRGIFWHPKRVYALHLTPDGKTLLSGSLDRCVRLWNIETGRLKTAPIYQPNFEGFSLSPGGRLTYADSDPGTAWLYDVQTAQPRGDRLHDYTGFEWWDFRANDTQLIHSGGWDVRVRRIAARVTGWALPQTGTGAAVFAPDGKSVYLPDAGGVRRHAADPDQPPLPWSLKQPDTSHLTVSPLGSAHVTVSGADHQAILWDAQGQKQAALGRSFRIERGQGSAEGSETIYRHDPIFRPDGRVILVLSGKEVRLFDVTTGQLLGPPLVHNEPVLSCAFSPDSSLLLTSCHDATMQVWNAWTGAALGAPLHPGDRIHQLYFPPGGKTVVLLGTQEGRSVRVVDIEALRAGKLNHISTFGIDAGHGRSVAFSPDGRLLLARSNRDNARLWELATGNPQGRVLTHGSQIDSVALSPDGTLAVTAGIYSPKKQAQIDDGPGERPDRGQQGRARLWDVYTGRPIGSPFGTERSGNLMVHFSTDGRWLLGYVGWENRLWPLPQPVAGEVERVRLWVEVSTGLELDGGGAVKPLNTEKWLQRRAQLDALGGPLPTE